MQVRFLKDWRRHRQGQTFSPDDGVGNVLIRRGIAKAVVEMVAESVDKRSTKSKKKSK